MTKIDIYSGFLGAGKTTLIKKMIQEAYAGEQLVLIENEFGEIGIDGSFMQDAGIQVNEMNSGCICCSLVGDFGKALAQVIEEYHPDRILIEPSGVGKLSDVVGAVRRVHAEDVQLGCLITVADATKVKLYLKNFGEFYTNQVETASAVILSRTATISQEKLDTAVALLREHNKDAVIITTPWEQLTGQQILSAVTHENSLHDELEELMEHAHHHHEHHEHDEHCTCGCHEHEHHHGEHCHEHEHHHHHEHDEHCTCGCHEHEHHHHGEHCHEHEHHHHGEHCHGHEHHHHDEHCHEHEHHHHEHDEHCTCGCHDHHHHHGHDADEVFQSWGVETPRKFSEEEIRSILTALDNSETYGMVLRAKGVVPAHNGSWIHFDHVPEEIDIRSGCAAVTGRLCVIGSKLNVHAIEHLFGV